MKDQSGLLQIATVLGVNVVYSSGGSVTWGDGGSICVGARNIHVHVSARLIRAVSSI